MDEFFSLGFKKDGFIIHKWCWRLIAGWSKLTRTMWSHTCLDCPAPSALSSFLPSSLLLVAVMLLWYFVATLLLFPFCLPLLYSALPLLLIPPSFHTLFTIFFAFACCDWMLLRFESSPPTINRCRSSFTLVGSPYALGVNERPSGNLTPAHPLEIIARMLPWAVVVFMKRREKKEGKGAYILISSPCCLCLLSFFLVELTLLTQSTRLNSLTYLCL